MLKNGGARCQPTGGVAVSSYFGEFQATPVTERGDSPCLFHQEFAGYLWATSQSCPLPSANVAFTPRLCRPFILMYRQMREDPQEADSGVRPGQREQVLPEQQEEPGTQPCGAPAPEGSCHPPPGLETLQET